MSSTALTTFDDIVVGDTWTSVGRTLTESDLNIACMTSGDWHPLHCDEEYSKKTPMGGRIFQGSYGLHIAVGMATKFPELGDAIIGALGFSEWKYLGPLFIGDTVHVTVEIASKRPTSDGKRGVLERRIKLINQKGKVIQEGVSGAMVRIDAAKSGVAT